MKYISGILIVLFSIVLFPAQKSADLIIHNAKIYTINQNFDVAESMAIYDGKIIAVGKSMRIVISQVTRSMAGNANYGEQNHGKKL